MDAGIHLTSDPLGLIKTRLAPGRLGFINQSWGRPSVPCVENVPPVP